MSESLLIDEMVKMRKALRDLLIQAEQAVGDLEKVGAQRAADTLHDAIEDGRAALNG